MASCQKLMTHKCSEIQKKYLRAINYFRLNIHLCSIHTSAHSNARKKKDYYKILGVSRDATDKDIRHAYLHVSMPMHTHLGYINLQWHWKCIHLHVNMPVHRLLSYIDLLYHGIIESAYLHVRVWPAGCCNLLWLWVRQDSCVI